jgi:hypothetical protein
MNWNIPLKLAESVVEWFWRSCEVKGYVVHLLEKYAKSTDTDIDDAIVGIVRVALLKNCPEK